MADYPAVAALWRAAGLTEEPEDDASEIATFLDAPQSAAFVAEEGDCLAGAVLCGSDGRYGYVHHLAVARDHRNTGLGRALTKACIHHLATRHVIVMVRDANDSALGFWRCAGFQRVDGVGVHYAKTDRHARP